MDEFQVIVMPDGEEIEFPASMSDDDIAVAMKSIRQDPIGRVGPEQAEPDAPVSTTLESAPLEAKPHGGPGLMTLAGAGLTAGASKIPAIVGSVGKFAQRNLPSKIISGTAGLAAGTAGYAAGGPIVGTMAGPAGYHAGRALTQKGGKALETAAEQAVSGVKDPMTDLIKRSVDLENKALALKQGSPEAKALMAESRRLNMAAERMKNANRVARATGQPLKHVTPKMTTLAKGLRGVSKLAGYAGPLMMLYDLISGAQEHEETMPPEERAALERLNPMLGVARGNTGMEMFDEELLKRAGR